MRVEDPETGSSEEFLSVTMNSKSRQNVDKVVSATSQFIKVETVVDLSSISGAKGESRSGKGISHTFVDSDHRQFMITLDEDDGPQLVTIYDGNASSQPNNLNELATKIRDAVRAIDLSRNPYKDFACTPNATTNQLTLTSGEEGDGSFVRVTSTSALDAARVLQLGVANGGREIDAAASIRPAAVGTTSGDLSQLPSFTSGRQVLVTIDGDGPHKVTIFESGIDQAPTDLKAFNKLLQRKLQATKPDLKGSMVFKGITSRVVGNTIQILSGSPEPNSIITIENVRIRQVLNDVSFISDNHGWAVGDGGTILHTDDGGTTWNPQTSRVSENLRGVYFKNETNGWAVGNNGTILLTDNGGNDWKPPTTDVPVSEDLLAVYFKNATDGIVAGAGGTILLTDNGGNDWKPPTTDVPVSEDLRGVYFRSGTDKAWVVGNNGTILLTVNGGNDWKPPTTDVPVSEDLRAVYFEDEDNGLAVGNDGTILDTSDGGHTWLLRPTPVGDSSADDLRLSPTTGSQNVKAYTLGIGKSLGAQSGATSGQDGEPPQASDYQGSEAQKTGIYALLDVDLFNILCLPGVTDFELNDAIVVLSTAVSFCKQRRAFLIIDCPESWLSFDDAIDKLADFDSIRSENAAMYFPRVKMPDPLDDNRLRTFPPCGIAAGIYARTDSERGVWKAPAGQEATLAGVRSMVYKLNDRENGMLNPLALNCLRTFPVIGPIIWGARTLDGADVLASEWKYIPVRRTALFIEESLYRGLKWVVFEPNDEPLWSQIRLNVGAFMHRLFRQGAFQGSTPREAYFVKCDSETTTQTDINLGIVNIVVGFAPLKPAEFVIIKIQQIAGQIQT